MSESIKRITPKFLDMNSISDFNELVELLITIQPPVVCENCHGQLLQIPQVFWDDRHFEILEEDSVLAYEFICSDCHAFAHSFVLKPKTGSFH